MDELGLLVSVWRLSLVTATIGSPSLLYQLMLS